VRVALFGSPAFAIPTLHALNSAHELKLVVTQPDKPVGRGLKLQAPATAQAASSLGLRLEQPARLKKNEGFRDLIAELELDVAVTAAYGKILPQALLDTPLHGFLNVHGSLLPKYRGAAPVQWALINGETETGISIMQTEAGLDTGAVRHVKRLDIAPEDTAADVFNALSTLGAEAILEALDLLTKKQLPVHPQDDSAATYSPMFTKDDGRIRWDETAEAVYNRYRGVMMWPGSWTLFNNKLLKVHKLEPVSGNGQAGEVLTVDASGVVVAAAEGAVKLFEVQAPNKAKMSAADWANGYAVKPGVQLGN